MTNELQTKLDTILAEKNTSLKPENLKAGVTCLGIEGIMEAGIDTSDANAVAGDIVYGKTAYVNGEKVTGNINNSKHIQNMWNDDDPWGDGSIYTANFNNVPCLVVANHFKVTDDTDIKMLITSKADGTGTVIQSIAPTENVAESIGLTADKIVKGNTILGIEGTCDYYEYTEEMPATSISRVFLSRITKISTLNTTGIANFNGAFQYMENLLELPLIDTSSATTMRVAFQYMRKLKSLPAIDTSNVIDAYCMLAFCESLTTLPLLDLSSVTNAWGMCGGCYNLIEIPQFDLSLATDTGCMCDDCYSLETVPVLNISSSLKVEKMFGDCSKLTDDSLNNILATLTGATAYIAQGTNMTLAHVGLSEEQAAKCATLSNYEAFIAAGWSY